jgi:amino acid adenylation domain-containing protein
MKCALSFHQERLWFLDRFENGHDLPVSPNCHHLLLLLRGRGRLGRDRVTEALRVLAARHGALRTRIVTEGETAIQVIEDPTDIACAEIDLGAMSQEAALERVLADACRPPSVPTDALVRAALVRFGCGDEFLLTVTLHHLVCDKPSLRTLATELAEILRAGPTSMGQGAEVARAVPELQFSDYAEWQRALAVDALEPLFFYWKWQLRGRLAQLELPTARPRPAVRGFAAARHAFVWDATMAGAVRALAARENSEPAAVTLATFQVLLHRYANQDEIVLGTSLPCRRQPGAERLVGPVANLAVLRQHLGGNPGFLTLLSETTRTLREARDHQELPFELLVRALKPEPDLSRHALFDVHFGHDEAPLPILDCGNGVSVQLVDPNIGYGSYDLNLALQAEADGRIAGVVVYHGGLFDAWFIAQLMGHFTAIAAAITAEPTVRIDELPLIDATQRKCVVEGWNDTTAKYPLEFCLHELLMQQAALTPSAPAVTFEGVTLSYGELDRRANQLAHWLRRAGVQPDTLVGVCAERSIELVVALLGVLKAGGAYVPLDPAYPRERLAFMLEDAAVPVLLTQEKFAAECRSLPAGDGEDGSSSGDSHRGQADSSPRRPKILSLDADWPEVARETTEAPATGVTPDHLAYLIYTSGSTGRPKGAGNTHRAIVNRLQWMQATYRLTPADTVAQKTPFSFDVSVWEFFWPLLAGARLVLARPGGHQDPAYLADLASREQVTTMHFVPSMLGVFVEEPGIARCTALRQVFSSGEALSVDLQERFFARHPAELHNLYGPTEAAVDVAFWRCERGGARPAVPIGRPIARTQLFVLDQRGELVPVGVAGELHIGGMALARGYHRRPDLTAEKFIPNRFGAPGARLYRTGDLARWLPDGALEYLGRIDHQVKIRGFRIELGEIEAALVRQPGVRESVVTVREAGAGEKTLVAYLVAAAGVALDFGELRRALRATLPDYMVPADFVGLPALPLTPSGKVDRRALPEPEKGPRRIGAEFTAPRTVTEEKVAGIFAAVLRRERVGMTEDFFALGGHSLLATQLVSRVRERFGVELPLRHVFEAPTAGAFAAVIDGQLRAAAPARAGIPAINRTGRRPRQAAAATATTSTL